MSTLKSWRLPRTQIELHAEHLAVRLLLARPQLVSRCSSEISMRTLRRRKRASASELDFDPSEYSDADPSVALLEQARLALAQRTKLSAITGMNQRLAPVVELLRLNECERELLRIFSMALENSLLADVLMEVQSLGRHAMMGVLSKVMTHDRTLLFSTLREGTLVRMGLTSAFELHVCAETLLGGLLQACLEPNARPEAMLKHVLSPAPQPKCQIDDFNHLALPPQAVTQFLKVARAQRRGVHVLLHGQTGTGKTEFSRAIAADLGWSLFEVPVEATDQSAHSGKERVAQYALSQRILERGETAILAFDEAEDLFPDPQFSWFLFSQQGLPKGWINRLLEEAPVPTLWMANQVGQIDPAILRRFDLIIEVKPMPIGKRREMIEASFAQLPLSPAWRERLAGFDDLAPAEVERLARVACAFADAEPKRAEQLLDRAMNGSRRAMGMPTRPRSYSLSAIYRPEWTNANQDLEPLAQSLIQRPEARLCLYGPPGTGKSAFAHYLSQLSERPLIAKRASDLVDCYIGNTEKNIAAAFDEARDQDAILLIDEADSFLMDRQRAQRSWEVSQVNELLAQMEDYEGLLVMTTNLFENLDPAVLRRFDLKIKFDYLRRNQRSGLLNAFKEDLALQSNPLEQQAAETRLSRLDRLTPGDYAVVARQARINGGMSVAEFSARLAAEQALKIGAETRTVGFV